MKKKIEVILLGEGQVGKTQIINQLKSKIFDDKYIKTYTPKETKMDFKIVVNDNKKTLNLDIYDLPGTKQFRSINNTFLKTSKIVLLIYDITNIDSCIELYSWNELLLDNKNDLLKCLIANKNDLNDKREISKEEGEKFAENIGALFYETNAKTYEKIYDTFNNIVNEYYEQFIEGAEEENEDYLDKENIKKNKIKIKEERKKDRCMSRCDSNVLKYMDIEPFLYKIKMKSSNKDIDNNNNQDEKEEDIQEIIKYKNGNVFKGITGVRKRKGIIEFSNGDIFEGKLGEEHNVFITGVLKHENLTVNIYKKEIVNMIYILIINNQEINDDKIKHKQHYRLDNNFVLKIKFQNVNNINVDNNLLEKIDVILFVCEKIDDYDYIKKFESIYNKIIEIKNEKLTFGVLASKECLDVQELNNKIKAFKDLINGFIEQIDEPFNDELEVILKNIKDKHLNFFINEVNVFENGTYIGDLMDDKKNGFGVMLSNNEVIYIGHWENDAMNGKGYFRNCFYDIYQEGEFKNDELINGERGNWGNFIYKGDFYKNDIYEGVYKYFDFLEYTGTLKGKYLYGKMKIKNGIEYEGKFENILADQEDYDILFNKEGEGKIIYSNGDIYEGKWANFRKNGKGKIITEDGKIYECEWKEDKEITNGIIIFENGDIFINVTDLNKDEEEDNIELNFDVENFQIEEKINYIEEYLEKASDLNNIEIYDDDLGLVKYDINEINKIWRIGQNISEYIKDINKIIFFKDFLISSFNQNNNNKFIISKRIETLVQIINYNI